MYHKIRITVVSLVVVAICMLTSVATLSYFTDTDGTINSFAIGNASTKLVIYNNVAGGDENIFDPSDYTLENNMNIPFYLQATNDGNIPVYQRFRVVIPIALSGVVTLDLPTMDNNCTIVTTSENTCSNTNYTVTYKPSVESKYAEYYIVNNSILAKEGTTSDWPTLNIRIGDISSVDNEAFTCGETENDCVLGIHAYSDAIQTTGFNNAAEAFGSVGEIYN